jgi:hypothetical protein
VEGNVSMSRYTPMVSAGVEIVREEERIISRPAMKTSISGRLLIDPSGGHASTIETTGKRSGTESSPSRPSPPTAVQGCTYIVGGPQVLRPGILSTSMTHCKQLLCQQGKDCKPHMALPRLPTCDRTAGSHQEV